MPCVANNGRRIVLRQAELELLRECREYQGDLILGGDVKSLAPLESLEVVTGRLAIGTRFQHWRIQAQLMPIDSLAPLAKLRAADTLELSR